jgi:hypothetical protein
MVDGEAANEVTEGAPTTMKLAEWIFAEWPPRESVTSTATQ